MKTAAVLFLVSCVLCIAAPARTSVSAREVTGTFRAKWGSEFRIEALGAGKLHVEFHGLYPYRNARGEETANMGYADGTATIEGDTATFRPNDVADTCTIVLKFVKRGVLHAEEEEGHTDCGFGHNVRATGTYRKVSGSKPKFGEDN